VSGVGGNENLAKRRGEKIISVQWLFALTSSIIVGGIRVIISRNDDDNDDNA